MKGPEFAPQPFVETPPKAETTLSRLPPIVLSLCDRTGVMVKPWLEAGVECWIVDLQHPPGVERDGQLVRVGADVRNWLPPRRDYLACFAFPPCTDLAVSGARHFRRKGLGSLSDALGVVEACRAICDWTDAPWCLENPVSTISTYWRPPDFRFDPCDFGGWVDGRDTYTKRTCLWVGGGFNLPQSKRVAPVEGSRMHRLPPSADRGDQRSVTAEGFARAVFAANAPTGSIGEEPGRAEAVGGRP